VHCPIYQEDMIWFRHTITRKSDYNDKELWLPISC
jgi:hypothetical protein